MTEDGRETARFFSMSRPSYAGEKKQKPLQCFCLALGETYPFRSDYFFHEQTGNYAGKKVTKSLCYLTY